MAGISQGFYVTFFIRIIQKDYDAFINAVYKVIKWGETL
jgi:hypothetical protein